MVLAVLPIRRRFLRSEDEDDLVADGAARNHSAVSTVRAIVQDLDLAGRRVHAFDAIPVENPAGRIAADIVDNPLTVR